MSHLFRIWDICDQCVKYKSADRPNFVKLEDLFTDITEEYGSAVGALEETIDDDDDDEETTNVDYE